MTAIKKYKILVLRIGDKTIGIAPPPKVVTLDDLDELEESLREEMDAPKRQIPDYSQLLAAVYSQQLTAIESRLQTAETKLRLVEEHLAKLPPAILTMTAQEFDYLQYEIANGYLDEDFENGTLFNVTQ